MIRFCAPDGSPVRVVEPDGAVVKLELDLMEADPVDGIPTVITTPRVIIGLPAPTPGVYLIVASVIAAAARDQGRPTWDLLVPNGQIRNSQGQPIGCRNLARVNPRD